jgi:hypothetical protein
MKKTAFLVVYFQIFPSSQGVVTRSLGTAGIYFYENILIDFI